MALFCTHCEPLGKDYESAKDWAGDWIDRKMAAEVDDDPPISQNSELSSFRSFKQAGLDRRRPS